MLTVACVRTGTRYGFEYVERLRNAARRHLPVEHRFICLTDQPERAAGVDMVDISDLHLDGWWGKMALFSPRLRGAGRCVYFDLDTVVVGDLSPLAGLDREFAICGNFTRAAGHQTWPCRYGSCCMVFGDGFGGSVWQQFHADRGGFYRRAGPHGDQWAIEKLIPNAAVLQDVMPAGFFLGYRDLPEHRVAPPAECSVVVFAGRSKPHNCEVPWVKAAWQ